MSMQARLLQVVASGTCFGTVQPEHRRCVARYEFRQSHEDVELILCP